MVKVKLIQCMNNSWTIKWGKRTGQWERRRRDHSSNSWRKIFAATSSSSSISLLQRHQIRNQLGTSDVDDGSSVIYRTRHRRRAASPKSPASLDVQTLVDFVTQQCPTFPRISDAVDVAIQSVPFHPFRNCLRLTTPRRLVSIRRRRFCIRRSSGAKGRARESCCKDPRPGQKRKRNKQIPQKPKIEST